MIHLLDVNVLLALHYTQHVHHSRAVRWSRCLWHLLELASSYGATFVTLDSRIPGALWIPELPGDGNHVGEPRLTYGATA